MKLVRLTVTLEIDTDDDDMVEQIINDMDYSFSYVRMEEGLVGKTLEEKQYIVDTEIVEHEIIYNED